MGPEEKSSAIASIQAIASAIRSNSMLATLRRISNAIKTPAYAEAALTAAKRIVSTAKITLAVSAAPSEIAAGPADVNTITSNLEVLETIALIFSIHEGGPDSHSIECVDLVGTVGTAVVPKIKQKPYEGQIQITLGGAARANGSAPTLVSEMLRACDLVSDYEFKSKGGKAGAWGNKSWGDRSWGEEADDKDKDKREKGGRGKGKGSESQEKKAERNDMFAIFAEGEKKVRDAGNGAEAAALKTKLAGSLSWTEKTLKSTGKPHLEFRCLDVKNHCLPRHIGGRCPFKSCSRAASRVFQGPYLTKDSA